MTGIQLGSTFNGRVGANRLRCADVGWAACDFFLLPRCFVVVEDSVRGFVMEGGVMAFGIRRRVTWLGLVLTTVGVAAAMVVRSDRFKRWFVAQMAVPRGLVGWVFARWMTYLRLHVYDVYSTAAERLDLGPDDELVHVGCETGAFLDRYASRARRVAGVDASELQVRLANRRLADRISAGTAEIIHGDVGDLPWDDNTFSTATCIDGTLLSYADPDAVLAEMFRVLQPGGRLVVDIGIDETDEACVKECDWWGIPHPPEEEARKMVENAGFSLVSVSYLGQGYLARFLEAVKP